LETTNLDQGSLGFVYPKKKGIPFFPQHPTDFWMNMFRQHLQIMFQQFSPNARNIYKLHQIALLFGGGPKKNSRKFAKLRGSYLPPGAPCRHMAQVGQLLNGRSQWSLNLMRLRLRVAAWLVG